MQKVLEMDEHRRASAFSKKAYAALKRCFDIIVSLVFMIVLLPVCLVVAVIAAIDTKSSPIFVQTRMGRYNRPFQMLKFRTMSRTAPANVATYNLNCADTYITKAGRVLRRLSLDEIPQLFNILKGDMSFIGPRPVILCESELLEMRTRNGASDVRPGMSGWAQVNGRDNVSIPEKAEYDGYYASHMSLRLDAKVLFKTIGYVLRSRGVSEGANPDVAAGKYVRERSA